VLWLMVLHKIAYNRWSWCIGRYGATSLEGCSRAVNVSLVQIELIPSHRKIRPLHAFFMLRWDWYGYDKKRVGTHYAEIVFLRLGESAGYIVHSGASEA
jgi:hypothetical protein